VPTTASKPKVDWPGSTRKLPTPFGCHWSWRSTGSSSASAAYCGTAAIPNSPPTPNRPNPELASGIGAGRSTPSRSTIIGGAYSIPASTARLSGSRRASRSAPNPPERSCIRPVPSIAPGIVSPASRPRIVASTVPLLFSVARIVAPDTRMGPRFSLKRRSTSTKVEPRPDRLPSTSNSDSRPATFQAPGFSTSNCARSKSSPIIWSPLLRGSMLIRAPRTRIRMGWSGRIETASTPTSTLVMRTATE